MGFTVHIILSVFDPKHRLWVLVRTATMISLYVYGRVFVMECEMPVSDSYPVVFPEVRYNCGAERPGGIHTGSGIGDLKHKDFC